MCTRWYQVVVDTPTHMFEVCFEANIIKVITGAFVLGECSLIGYQSFNRVDLTKHCLKAGMFQCYIISSKLCREKAAR